uniref:SH3 domain-containing protein n=1 Tax=Heterorhabditis bacteriophora TaxID=37862 RepID=A0A1I7W870_HETBA
MLNGLYGYIFGSEDSNDSQMSQDSEAFPVDKTIENDWCLVEDVSSGRSSPVFIPYPEMRDIDQLSFTSKNSTVKNDVHFPHTKSHMICIVIIGDPAS